MSKKEFVLPQGRLAKVMSDANYGKIKKYKVNDFFNQKKNTNPRLNKKEEDSLKGCKDFAYHQNDIKNLMKGQPEKKYNKDEIFETNKKCPKGKKICNCSKKQNNKKTPKIKNPIKQYKNDFHTLY